MEPTHPPQQQQPRRRGSRQARHLATLLAAANPPVVDTALRDRLAAAMAPISPRRLRDLLRATGATLDCLVEGVRQDSLEQLERTLAALAHRYAEAPTAAVRQECRRMVIESKQHARLAALRLEAGSPERAMKEEMVLWMLTWLENPGVFTTWASLRRQAIESRSPKPE